jgi:hypothetical protein
MASASLAKLRLRRWLRPRIDLRNASEPHDLRYGGAFVLFVPIGAGEEYGLAQRVSFYLLRVLYLELQAM